MRNRKGIVLYKDEIAGIIEEIPSGGSYFSYNNNWNELSIACSLPVYKRNFEWNNGLHPFFQNLLSEGWLRDKKSQAGNINEEDDFGHLLRYGKECIGAVGIIDARESETPDIIISGSALENSIKAHSNLSGVHKKIFVYKSETDNKYHPANDKTPSTHIAKFNDDNIESRQSLVRNEFKSLKLAQSVLGKEQVVNFTIADVENYGNALIVERFDRQSDGTKLRMEEFAQILNKPIGLDKGGKYNGSYEEIAVAIREHSSLPKIDLLLFFKLLLFNIIICNSDAHLKNFALLETPSGLRLSPAYDLLNAPIYDISKHDFSLALYLNGKKPFLDTINKKILFEFALNIGLNKETIELVFNDFKNKFKNNSILKPSEAEQPEDFNNSYKYIVDASCQRILID
jgi:serine/threonine-protein kinase HipA